MAFLFFFLSVLIFENSVGDQFNSSNNIKSVAISLFLAAHTLFTVWQCGEK